MRNYMMVLVLVMAWGCASLNKQREKTETDQLLQLKQKEQQVRTTHTAKVRVDTGSSAIDVVFWPKGIVKYSPTTGFEGEATRIGIRSKAQNGKLLSEINEQHLLSSKVLTLSEDQHSKVKTALKAKKQLGLWTIAFWLILGICAAVVYLFYKRKLVWVK